jgi:hypothetical protein
MVEGIENLNEAQKSKLDISDISDSCLKKECKHEKSYVRREGITSMLGTVICPDCGYERDWDAY